MTSSTVCKAVIFDLYETLISEYVPTWKSKQTTAQRLGVDEDVFRRKWVRIQRERFTGEIPDFVTALRHVCERLEHAVEEGILQQLWQERLQLKRRPFERVEKTVVEMLVGLDEFDVKVGVLSNAAREEVMAWPDSVLAGLVDEAIFSCDVGAMKPDPAIYHLICERLAVAPTEALFVGDGGSDELVGASAVGLQPLWATWFLEQWPAWKGSDEMRERSARFPQLREPSALLQVVASSVD